MNTFLTIRIFGVLVKMILLALAALGIVAADANLTLLHKTGRSERRTVFILEDLYPNRLKQRRIFLKNSLLQ